MTPLIRKELRLILPFLGIALFLAVVPSFVAPADSWVSGINEIIFWAFAFGAVLLGLAPFGQEFSLGTFPALLAQPLERRQMWKTKILLILVAALLVMLSFIVAVHFRLAEDLRDSMERFVVPQHRITADTRLETLQKTTVDFYHSYFWVSCVAGGAVLLFVGLAGGFWTSLLFRQTGAALWFAILIPGVILVVAEIFGHLFLVNPNFILIPALTVYAIAGFIWARRMFFEAQDAQWLGGTISFLSLSSAKPQTDLATVRRQKPLAALVRKELQSHQVSLLIAFGLLVLHIATLVFRGFNPMTRNSELRFAVEAVPLLWLMLPWVIGSVAVAEERKLGTMEGQLCLPVSRGLQFIVKLLVVLFLGIVLGGFIPLLVEGLGALAHVSSDILQEHSSPTGVFADTAPLMLLAAGTFAFISFYASTLTRNTLHALGMGVVLGGSFIALFQWLLVESRGYYDYALWHGPLILFTMIPVWIIAVLWLSFSNYKRLHAGRNVWLRNALVLLISLTFVGLATAVVYQRPWELAMTLEPKHGPSRLSGPVRPVMCTIDERAFALLPDGRLWAATDYEWKTVDRYRTDQILHQTNVVETIRFAIPHGGMFVGGSNWVALAANASYSRLVALQSDGSLWSVISIQGGTNFWKRWLGAVPEPRRIGSDNDWKSIAAGQGYFVGVKNDGSLWHWGAVSDISTEDRVEIKEPKRFDAGSDWARVFSGSAGPLFVKENGDVFQWVEYQGKFKLSPVNLNASNWLDVGGEYQPKFAIRNDGSLWSWGSEDGRFFGNRISGHLIRIADNMYSSTDRFVRIGSDSDWAQVSGEGPYLFGLKKDGRLVKNGTDLFSATLGRPSAYSDWLAIHSHWGGLTALSADGTVCQWQDTRSWGSDSEKIFLGPTRRPFWTLNIFSDSKN